MKSVYNSYVSEEFAKKLLSLGFRLYVYNTGTYDGKPAFFTLDENDPMWESCDRFRIPTYAEILDMLLDRDIVISIEPTNESEFQYSVHLLNEKEMTISGTGTNFKDALDEALFIAINL